MVLRYITWRTTNTLPPSDDLLFLCSRAVPMVSPSLCFSSVCRCHRSDEVSDQPYRRGKGRSSGRRCSVPTYEPPYILVATLSAARRMHYPSDKLKIYLLDDGTGERLAQRFKDPSFAGDVPELGVNYLTRRANKMPRPEI